ncbi:MAG TPA: diguanylate cyclase [Acidimicrobiales bacterium]|nr:diguanylate cyclase [Acidimicrobiales bacterium]
MATLLLVTAGSAAVVLGVYHPRIQNRTDAVTGLRRAHAGLLDQETGLRGFLLARDAKFLQPYNQGRAETSSGNAIVDRSGLGSPELAAVTRMRAAEERWSVGWAERAATPPVPGGGSPAALGRFLDQGKALFDAYRRAYDPLVTRVDDDRQTAIEDERLALIATVGLDALVAVGVLLLTARERRRAVEAAVLHGATESLSLTDPLTGLPNRRSLDEALKLECDRARRYGRPLAFVMFDVDHFKRINDSHGHPYGDAVLSQLAQVLLRELRTTDTAYRYGGEEFAILARDSPVDGAVRLAERLRGRIALRFDGQDGSGTVTASFGVAGAEDVELTPEGLVDAADAALYAAKRRGRDRVVTYAQVTDESPADATEAH